MTFRLPADCLNEIIMYLEDDVTSLGSCLLVDRLWCQISVRILWKNIWIIRYNISTKPYRKHVPSSILSTLIACLPNESKNLLNANGISIPTPTPNLPLFNYISFIKVLLSHRIERMIGDAL